VSKIQTTIRDLAMNGIVKFWNEFFSVLTGEESKASNPLANAYVEGNILKFELAAPGHEQADFIIAYNEKYDQLSISAKGVKVNRNGKTWLRNEYNYESFTRMFQLERKVIGNEMKKYYRSGILYVEFPVQNGAENGKAI
jgi:HSP20 family molecular chaperone IbpA